MKKYFLLAFPSVEKCISAQYALKSLCNVVGDKSMIETEDRVMLFKDIDLIDLNQLELILLTEEPIVLTIKEETLFDISRTEFSDFISAVKNGESIENYKSVFEYSREDVLLNLKELI